MQSALYVGRVRHRRLTPKAHAFAYDVPFFYLDLAEITGLFRWPGLMAERGPSVLAFRRRDYLGPGGESLDDCVRGEVERKFGVRPTGPIRVLTQISYFGFCFNPISIYYCFDQTGERVRYIVAQVTNTPWHQRHAYAVEVVDDRPLHFVVPKDFHVSPFMPMNVNYHWRLTAPGARLTVHMENRVAETDELTFDATMALAKMPLGAGALAQILWRFPLLTLRAYVAIYWQALLLILKKIPFHPHPGDV